MMHTKSKYLLLFFLATACQGGATTGPNDGEKEEGLLVAGATYSDLRALENAFPIPSGSQTVDMGTMNTSTGQFTGLGGQRNCQIDPVTHKPICSTFPAQVDIHAVGAVLVFHASSVVTPFRVTVNGRLTTAPAGATTLTVDVMRAKTVDWTLEAGTATASARLIINRPGVLGAGVFTLGALPISLLYEPPQTGAGLSYTALTTTETVGSSVTVTHETEDSTSHPSFTGVSGVVDKLNTLKSLIQLWPGLSSPILNGTIDRLTAAFGTSTSTEVSGTNVSDEHTLELSSSTSLGFQTNAGLGPGRGDRVLYLRDAQVAWVMLDGDVSLALIGYRARAAFTVEQLKNDRALEDAGSSPAATVSQLDHDSLDALIALDPMTAPPPRRWLGVVLPSDRFTLVSTEEGDGPETFTVSHGITQTDKSSKKTFHASETEFHAGWLSALGFGPDSSSHKVTTSVSEQRSNTMSQQVSATLHMESTVGSPYRVEVYFDNIFSTFLAKAPNNIIVVNPSPIASQ